MAQAILSPKSPREKFQDLLKKLFQFDCAELDFGIYRIMNQRRSIIEKFIEKDLLDGVAQDLKAGALAQEAGFAQQLTEVGAQIKETLGEEALDAEGNLATEYRRSKLGKQYLSLRQRAAGAKSSPEQESEIFNHLYTFFSRYYDDGDFMSLRRYSKRDKYAIPYNGEDVHFHWANAGQYYVKTGENFTDYRYTHGGWTVQFKLRNADVEQNNVRGPKRFFVPRVQQLSLDQSAKTVTLPFEYRQLDGDEEYRYGKGENGITNNGNGKERGRKGGQEGILSDALQAIAEAVTKYPPAQAALMSEKRRDAEGNVVSLIEHHLRTYTRANTSDFFVHRDLKSFLDRELDFYLKNELLNLDELDAGGEERAEGWFQLMRTIRGIGSKIISFVSQIENFQKGIFEKKKFVTEVHYCTTLDRVPEALYPEIVQNSAQIEEWKRLFSIHTIQGDTTGIGFCEPLDIEFLKGNLSLVLDTKFFPESFRDALLTSTEFLRKSSGLDDAIDGLLLLSENFQALRMLLPLLKGRVDCFYLDPPYNTDASPIAYKNGYKASTWTTLMHNRLSLVPPALKDEGTIAVAIDDTQHRELSFILSQVFAGRLLGTFCVRSNPSGRPTQTGYSVAHEYVIYAGASARAVIGRMPPTPEQMARFSEKDEGGPFEWRNLRREGSNSDRSARKKLYYPIYITKAKIRVPPLIWNEDNDEWVAQERPKDGETEILPDNEEGQQKTWRWEHEKVMQSLDSLAVRPDRSGRDYIYYKRRPHEDGVVSVSTWFDAKYSATEHGTATLKKLFRESPFPYPKSTFAVADCLYIGGASKHDALVCDFFAGSGTTAHAVIDLNRRDEGKRKYILVEVEKYFETTLKPRIQKVIYSKDWEDGKPVSRRGSSHAFKYIRLESYEDALDNITFEAMDSPLMFQLEDFVLSYMLDFETKGSNTLLNVVNLDTPFDYKLHRHGKDEPLHVDLPETFNYLIGMQVESRRAMKNKEVRYLIFRGRVEERTTVIIWRTTRGWGQKEFEADRDFVIKHKLTQDVEEILVNTDSFILGARSLDPVFKRRMFNEE
jgi:adenine-specific DNA-methyltransferase